MLRRCLCGPDITYLEWILTKLCYFGWIHIWNGLLSSESLETTELCLVHIRIGTFTFWPSFLHTIIFDVWYVPYIKNWFWNPVFGMSYTTELTFGATQEIITSYEGLCLTWHSHKFVFFLIYKTVSENSWINEARLSNVKTKDAVKQLALQLWI